MYVHLYMHVCLSIHEYVFFFMSFCLCARVFFECVFFAFTYMCAYVCMYVCMCVYAYVGLTLRAFPDIFMYMYIFIYT
jgi:hypothetical protein